MISKQILIPAMLMVVGSSIVLGTTYVSAQEGLDSSTSIVNKIAQKFGLKTEDVQAVFDEHHAEMKTQMKGKLVDRLSQLVSEGKITEAQKEAIMAKMDELSAARLSLNERSKEMTPEERKAEMEKTRAELEAWAKEQGLDLSAIGGLFFGHHKGFGFRKMIVH